MPVEIAKDIFWTGVNDLHTPLFEELWPLPQGISYNAYFIRGEKTALIDAVKRDFAPALESSVQKLLRSDQNLDYLVINHIEPDHSGALESLLGRFPDLCIVGNDKTLHLLREFHRFPAKTLTVRDRQTLDLGGRKLDFLITPMVHWPETMMTFDRGSGILFSGDVFGSFGSLPKGIFDDEVNLAYFEEESRRYFSNVLAKYGSPLQKALSVVKGLDAKIIAPTHGPVYRKNPARIRDLYDGWSLQRTERGAVVVCASMYGHTQRIAKTVERALFEGGIQDIKFHHVSHSHLSYILSDIWRFRGLVLAGCTYNTRLFPPMELLLGMLENDRLQGRLVGIAGSGAWANGALPALRRFAGQNGLTLVEPVIEALCSPSGDVLNQCGLLGKNLAKRLLES